LLVREPRGLRLAGTAKERDYSAKVRPARPGPAL